MLKKGKERKKLQLRRIEEQRHQIQSKRFSLKEIGLNLQLERRKRKHSKVTCHSLKSTRI